VFGAITGDDEIGFPVTMSSAGGQNSETLLMPYLNVLSDFRENVRNVARQHKGSCFNFCQEHSKALLLLLFSEK